MKKTNTVLVLVIVVAVNLSNGYSIKAPSKSTTTFSGSSSSSLSSAFAHSSSSSYTFNGPIDPDQLEKLKASAAVGATASAGAGAGAGSLAGLGAAAHAAAGAFAHAGSGTQIGSGALTGSGAHVDSSALAGSGSLSGFGSIGGGSGEYVKGVDAGSDSISTDVSSKDDGSGCTGAGGGCGGGQNSNVIGSSSLPSATGGYKIINTNKYNTGYAGDLHGTNYAVAGQYVQGSQTAGGCLNCKGPFPGPNGSIHDYKLASTVPVKGRPSGDEAHAEANAGPVASYQPPKSTSTLPGASGSIYVNKPALDILPPAPSGTTHQETTGYDAGSGHISPNLIATFPGPTGSIYDSKPAGVVAATGTGAGTSAGSHYGDSGPVTNTPSLEPCKYTPGSSNKGCGGSIIGPAGSHSIGVLPGPSGSIFDSKPAYGPGAVIGSGASAAAVSHGGSGSVSNIPSSHPVVGPACSYSPGSSNKNCVGTTSSSTYGSKVSDVIPILPGPSGSIYDSKPAISVLAHGVASGGAAGAGAGSYSGSGSVSNIPSSHPVVQPACSYTPGSPNSCSGISSTSEQKATPGSSASISPILPGSSGSIYESKPAISVSAQGVASGEAAGAGAGSYSGSGSVSNIPSTYPVVGPACSYTPGSPNSCSGISSTSEQKVTPGSSASVSPILPGSSGSIYTSKPTAFYPGAGPTTHSGSGAGAGIEIGSGSYSDSGSVSNIPSTHPVVGPICSYTPGSPNKCIDGTTSQSGVISGAGVNAAANAAAGCLTCKGPFPGPNGSIHDYKLVSSLSSSGFAGFHGGLGAYGLTLSPPFGSQVHVPSIHPQVPSSQGTYYINKHPASSKDIEVPLVHSVPSFSGQIPCSDSTCGSEISNHNFGSLSGIYSGEHSGAHDIAFVDKDNSGKYGSISHDDAHKSGGIVYDGGDGSYYNVPTTGKPTIKNAEHGGYAVNSDDAQNTGILIGPGTGQLPIETDVKPFGTQGAYGGSVAFVKGAAQKNDKPFGTQGAFGGSDAFVKGSSGFQSSGNQLIDTRPCAVGDCSSSSSKKENGFATGHVTIQKIDGTLGVPIDVGSYKPGCSGEACDSELEFVSGIASGSGSDHDQLLINKEEGSPVKLECSGASCGDTEVYILEEKPSKSIPGGINTDSGCLSGSCGGSGSGTGSGSGFATGQVLVQKGNSATYDLTNQSASRNENSYSGSHDNKAGSGCLSGSCGGSGVGSSSGSGFATGQVLVQKGNSATYDATNQDASGSEGSYSGSYDNNASSGCLSGSCGGSGEGSSSGSGFATEQVLSQKGNDAAYGTSGNVIGGSYSGSGSGSYSGNQFGTSGCGTGSCGGAGFGTSFGLASSGGLINKLFGPGGLSGTLNKYGGNGFGANAAYSNAGSYSSASAGSFASASASAHAGSFAHSF